MEYLKLNINRTRNFEVFRQLLHFLSNDIVIVACLVAILNRFKLFETTFTSIVGLK